MEIKAIWKRKPRSKSADRLAQVATELPDVEVARMSRSTRPAAVAAEQMRGLLRAGGGVVAHR